MNPNKNEENTENIIPTPPKMECIDGLKNWLIVMVFIFWTNLVFESYNRFGIVKGPIEIAVCLIDLTVEHSWLCFITLIYYFLQIAITFVLEKLLAKHLISEKVGMTLHAINVFLLPTAFSVLARISDANPCVCRVVSCYIVFAMVKIWSYAFVNRKFRKCLRQEITTDNKEKEDKMVLLQYPHNITVRNIITYMVFTPPVQYQVCYPQRTKPNWINFIKLCLQQFLVFYATAFMILQFVLPEMFILRAKGGGFTNILRCMLKIAVPFNVTWLLINYVNMYKTYLPAYAALTGMEYVTFNKDWWRAHDINMFWRRWNLPVHECLKHNVVFPLIRNGYSKTTANLVAFAIAGMIHEYTNSLPMGIYTGLPFLYTLTEMPAGYISEYIKRILGGRYGNLLLWIYLVIVHTSGITAYAFLLPHFAVKEFPFNRYHVE